MPRSALLFAAALLLFGTLGCSRKDDALPAAAPHSGSYKLMGIARACQASATTALINSSATNVLAISLVTVPEPATGKEYVVLSFTKLVGQPVTMYQMETAEYFSQGGTVHARYGDNVTSVTQTSSGGFSGTFAGTFSSTASQNSGGLLDGVFTDVQ